MLIPDPNEPNDTQETAKVLGSEPWVTIMNATLHAVAMLASTSLGAPKKSHKRRSKILFDQTL